MAGITLSDAASPDGSHSVMPMGGYPTQPVVEEDPGLEGRASHAAGERIFAQLWHRADLDRYASTGATLRPSSANKITRGRSDQ